MKAKLSETIKYYACNLVLLLIAWGGMIRFSFNADTLAHMTSQDCDVTIRLMGGRYLWALIDYVLMKMGLSSTTNIRVAEGLAILIFAASITVLQAVFKKWEPENLLHRLGYNGALSIVAINVFFVEMLMFAELCVHFAIAYLCAALTAYFYSKKKYAGAVIFLIFSTFTYQFALIFLAIVLVFYIALEAELTWSIKTVLTEAIAIGICGGMGIVNILSYKMLEKLGLIPFAQKSSSLGNFGEKISRAISGFVATNKNACGLMPVKYIVGVFLIAALAGCIIGIIKSAQQTALKILFVLTVLVVSVCLMYGIPLIEEEYYFPPRMAFVYFLIQGLLIASAIVLCKEDKYKSILSVICFGYLFVHIFVGQFILEDRFVSNTLDEEYAKSVVRAIEEYESQNGVTVTNIAVARDAYAKPKYDGIQFFYEQINERTVAVVPVTALDILGGKKFTKTEMPDEVYAEYFEGKDWDYFVPDEQLIFINDTVYWCIY